MIERPTNLLDVPTPALVLDLQRVDANCGRMIARADQLGVVLRPHMKTAKSADIARLATRHRTSGITVSTIAEIDYFATRGFSDILYAVGISASKVAPIADITRRAPADVSVLTDAPEVVPEIDAEAVRAGTRLRVFIEIDCGAGRGGVLANGPELLVIARAINCSQALSLAGVLTHAGHSYNAASLEDIRAIAENERAAVVDAANCLRAAGIDVVCVSVGSTPTAATARSLDGVTEMRPGVYTLFDLDQVALGTCATSDIAMTILATVIGHNPRSERLLIDAGALALSKDLSASKRGAVIGYGLLAPAEGGDPFPGIWVSEVHQEHGLVASNEPFKAFAARHPIGSRLRVLPNHACMSAGPHDRYYCVRGKTLAISDIWSKATGWIAA